MMSYIGIVVLGGILFYAWSTYYSFSENLASAKASNIRYVVAPVFYHSPLWVLSSKFLMPFLRKLPGSWTYPWLDIMSRGWTWEHQHSIYKYLGTDTFMVVTPGGNLLWTADPQVIRQMTARRNDFPKPIKMYRLIDLYGRNVVSTEGQVWRNHRKITGPPFTEKNNHVVWIESIRQTEAMLKACTGLDGEESRTIERVRDYSMRLSLHVISYAGFGKRLSWPGAKEGRHEHKNSIKDAQGGNTSDGEMSTGHTMTHAEALEVLLRYLFLVILIPRPILSKCVARLNTSGPKSFYRSFTTKTNTTGLPILQ